MGYGLFVALAESEVSIVVRLPCQGGRARHESIQEGRWDKWNPIPVKLVIDEFMEKDIEDVSQWYMVTEGKWIQGLVATMDQERRVYVVTITPEMIDAIHDRWPKILAG